MCTLVVVRRQSHKWPLIIGANRDEMLARTWKFPGRHWKNRKHIVGGLDEHAGGSWLSINDRGVIASILNRAGSLGPTDDKRSRGELVLKALDHEDAQTAAKAFTNCNGEIYQPFNLVIADHKTAFWLRNIGKKTIECLDVPFGFSMLTAEDINSTNSPRVKYNLPRFKNANIPNPENNYWKDWEDLLASNNRENRATGQNTAMCIPPTSGFGTVNSSLVAIPNVDIENDQKPLWRFAPGPPDKNSFLTVAL